MRGMSASNFIAFEVALTVAYVRLSNERMVADVTIYNQHGANFVYLSTDQGATRSTIPNRGSVTLRGVDLSEIWVASNSAPGTVISVTGHTPR